MSQVDAAGGGRGALRVGILLLPAAAILALGFGFPLLEMTASAFSDGGSAFGWVVDSAANRRVLLRTFEVSLMVTLVCVVVGYPFAYLMSASGRAVRRLLMVTVLIPLWTSSMIRSFSWVALLQEKGPVSWVVSRVGLGDVAVLGTTTAVVVGMAQVLLPFIVLPMYAVMSRIDDKLVPAAKSLGARPATAFVKVYLPLSMPGVFAGALLVFILALGFYITPALLGAPSNALVSTLITAQAQQLLNLPRASALAATLVAMTVVAIALAGLARWAVDRQRGWRLR